MDLDLTDRVVLITGANSPIGIGATTALRFCQEGARVALVYKRLSLPYDPERARLPGLDRYRLLLSDNAQAIERRLRETTEHYTIIEQDITAPGAAQRIFDRVEERLGTVEVLVNNAAEYAEQGDTILHITEDVIDRTFDVNVKATLLMIKEFVARRGDYGRIVNLSTDAAQAFPGQIAYGASKATTEAFTRSIAVEVGHLGITVNAVAPGPTQTGYISEEQEAALLPDIPLDRVGQPEDIADAILFLASARASWLTGQVIQVSGGHAL
jgi:3-oxoacyl-[acyl-carrier protein] reductase